jgi:hypothetical protein
MRVLASPGDLVGGAGRQPAILFAPQGPLMIRAEVQQEYAAGVKVGKRIQARDDKGGEPTWHGRVTHISDWYSQRRSVLLEPLQRNDVRTLECLITIDPGQPPLRLGQRMRVRIEDAAALGQ